MFSLNAVPDSVSFPLKLVVTVYCPSAAVKLPVAIPEVTGND